MTPSRIDNPLAPPPERIDPPPRQRPSTRQRVSIAVQLFLALTLAGGVFAYLVWSWAKPPSANDHQRPAPAEEIVEVVNPTTIRVRPNTPLESKLQIATVDSSWVTAPVLPVTGMAVASLRPGKEASQDSWQFATPDLLTAFSDWQKAVKDVQFQENQLKAVRDLNESRIDAQKKVVARMEKLVAAGTDTEKDLAVERTNLIQFEIQGRRDIHDAEQAVYLSRRTQATLARQLQQAGLEPTMLRSAAVEGEIVVAEVPERAMDRIKPGMTCEVHFFALPDRLFRSKVSSISPVISKEKRVLNVQFIVKDEQRLLRPGMFAQIGLGTDKRLALLMPADGVLHIGDQEYALLADRPGLWRITQIQTGEVQGSQVEVLGGVKAGDRLVGKGAILLKPALVHALQAPAPSTAAAVTTAKRQDKN